MNKYNYLIVGAGPFGSVCARELTDAGYKCLVIEKRNHIAGNTYTQKIDGINIHKYGAHIFHTGNKKVWDYVNRFSEFNNYRHTVVANYKDEIYSLPFNMYTFNTKEFGEVNIVVSSQPPGGAGKKNEAEFIDGLNNLIQVSGGSADIKLTSPELTLNFKNINEVIDSSKTGAGKGDKSDAQFISGGDVIANISLKQDGGFRWASVASNYKEFITKLVNKALKGELDTLTLKPNPDNPKKFLMFDPKTGNRITKIVIPDFPTDDIESWVFGPEEPKVIMVSKTWNSEDFSLDGGVITAKASHIYQTLDDIEKDNIDPVFAIMQHIGMSQGLDYRIIPSKQAKITTNARELSYDEVMS